jgi:hypothetical protein
MFRNPEIVRAKRFTVYSNQLLICYFEYQTWLRKIAFGRVVKLEAYYFKSVIECTW